MSEGFHLYLIHSRFSLLDSLAEPLHSTVHHVLGYDQCVRTTEGMTGTIFHSAAGYDDGDFAIFRVLDFTTAYLFRLLRTNKSVVNQHYPSQGIF